MRRLFVCVLLGASWTSAGAVARAAPLSPQEPSVAPKEASPPPAAPSDPPQREQSPQQEQQPRSADAPLDVGAGEIRIRAETQGGQEGHYWYRGFVDMQLGDVRIQADQLDFYRAPRPDGRLSQRIEAEGNVVFLKGEERLAGRRLRMDLDTNQGTFEDATGYVQPGVTIEARRIDRLDADSYRIHGGTFTSCLQPNPRWSFSASSATLDVDDKIVAKNVLFKVKAVPAFYIPVFMYPIQEDQRSTGFLFPHFGQSRERGFNVGGGFFWAMSRGADQTFYLDHYSKFGYGYGHEFRYARRAPSRGTFRSYGFQPKGGGTWDYDLDWNAIQMFPGRVRANVNVRQYSNTTFQQRFQERLDQITRRTRFSSVSLQRNFGATTIQLLADSRETFFGEQSRVDEHLPVLRLTRSPQKIGRTGLLFGFESRGENLGFGNQDGVDRYTRFDLNPRLLRPTSVSFLQITPEAQVRYTRYGASNLEGEGLSGGPLQRQYFEGRFEVRGPMFSRVLNTPGSFYSDRFKHVIGPEVVWTYRTRIDDFDAIPKADGNDYVLGTHELNYSLVQSFLAKRPGRSGKLEPYEFLNWRITQTYYVQIGNNQNEFDPNYSSSAFGPGGRPDHNSPVFSRVRLRPTPRVTGNFDMEYDVNFKQLRTFGLSTNVRYDRVRLQAGWSRARRVNEDPESRVLVRDTLRGSTRLELLPRRLALEGSADYDILNKNLIYTSGRLRYDVQCCGFTVEMMQWDYGSIQDRKFQFAIELANIGSIGNFLGEGEERRGSFAGLR
jgi:hypothetical protein